MADHIATVFGGTGFLGRRVVHRLREAGASVRVASRHAERVRAVFGEDLSGLEAVAADVEDGSSVAKAIAGATAVINTVSLYVEQRNRTFRSVHVLAAARLAKQAADKGVARVVHVSGIGADPRSRSSYIRSRGEGEVAVRDAFRTATIVRPAVMFGPDDAFIALLARLLRYLPAYPMFGRGETKLQPVYVDDVAAAIAGAALSSEAQAVTCELAGPHVYSYAELLRLVARHIGRGPVLLPVPFAAWRALAAFAEMLPTPLLTRNQVELMELDTTASPGVCGFSDLGISPHALEDLLPTILGKSERPRA